MAGVLARNARLAAYVRNGVAAIDPFLASLPGGDLDLRLSMNLNALVPPMALAVRASGVPIRPLAGAFGLPDDTTGTLDAVADLRSAGGSWRELAARLNGHVGLATSDVELDSLLLDRLFGPALRLDGLSFAGTAPPGRVPVPCFALRLDAERGTTTLRSLVVSTPALLLLGMGTLQPGEERLALRLVPVPGGGPRTAPMLRITGVFSNPTLYREPRGGAPFDHKPAEVCAAGLALARPPVIAPTPAPAPAPR